MLDLALDGLSCFPCKLSGRLTLDRDREIAGEV